LGFEKFLRLKNVKSPKKVGFWPFFRKKVGRKKQEKNYILSILDYILTKMTPFGAIFDEKSIYWPFAHFFL
jgi:hypothetical protein